MFSSKYVFAVVAAMLLAACGGGGGGGDAGGTGVDVSIAAHTPATFQAQAYEGQAYSAGVHVTFKGNFAGLNGKTIYVLTEVSGSALQGTPEVAVAAGDEPFADVSLKMGANENLTAGIYEGTAKLYACLDPDCHSQLGNSPLTMPYKVTIHAGLSLSLATVQREVPFGTKPPAQRMAVQLPEGATDWIVDQSHQTDGAFSVQKAADGSANIDISFAMATPGTRSQDFMVTAYAPNLDDGGRTESFQKWFTVNYTVQDSSGPPIAFDPASASYSFAQGSPEQGHELFSIVLAGGHSERIGTVYLSAPAAAAGSPKVNDWIWSDGIVNEYSVTPCDLVGGQVYNCLPAGDYSAVIRFRHTSPSGVLTDVDYPISMTLRP